MFLQLFTTILKSTKVVSFMFLRKRYTVDLLKPKEKVIRRAKLDIHCSGQMVIDDLLVFYITFLKILCIKYHTLIYSKTIFIFFDCFKIISNKDDVAN